MRKGTIRNQFALFLGALMLTVPHALIAQVMHSGSYKIQSDSINAGGSTAESTNYSLEDTAGEVGSGESQSGSYGLHAGYWQMQETYLAISTPTDLSLGSLSGITGVGSEGTADWTVTTDSPAGYEMTIQSATSPALISPLDSFADYLPHSAVPDYDFLIGPSQSAFGFSPEGPDVVARFKDNGTVCGSGTLETTGKCWDGLSTAPQTIVSRTSGNHPLGSTTTVRFRAENGVNHIQTSGNYSADITVTVTAL
jgi:hypothetical protein